MTPQQFLANPQAQDAVFKAKFGQYVNKYGPEGAARAWFAGEGGMNNPNAKDVNGTTVAQYGNRFMAALGGNQQNTQTAGIGATDNAQLPDPATPAQYAPQNGQQGSQGPLGKLLGGLGINISPEAKMAMMSAGFGMMGTHSPFLGTAIGEGAQQGLQTYTATKAAEQKSGIENRKVDLEAQKLSQSADESAKKLALETRKQSVTEMQPVKVGTDAMGHDIYAMRDPKTGQYRPNDPQTGMPVAPGAEPQASGETLHGEEYLKTLPPQIQNTVRQIANGDSDLGKVGFKDRTNMMNHVTQYDPSFNTYTAPLRAATAKNFTGTGVEARNFQSNDMAIKHIGTGLENIEAMKNSPIPLYNAIANPLARNMGDTKFQQANTALGTDIDAIGSELMRAFRGSGSASEKEATEWREKFPINGSPVEMRTAMKEAAKLLASRVSASGERYNDAMGPLHARDPHSWLSPEGREVFQTALNLDPQKPVPPRSQWSSGSETGPAPTQTGTGQIDPRDASALKANANNPAAAAAIDKKYGAGTAAKLLGTQ